MDPVKESLHLIIDSRSDIEPAPIIECVDIKVPTLMIQEFGEFWIYLATPSDQANRRCRQRPLSFPHRDVETLWWAIVTILVVHKEAVGANKKEVETGLPIGGKNSHGLWKGVFQDSREAGNSKMHVGPSPGCPRADLKE
jgi:hypothetical protein